MPRSLNPAVIATGGGLAAAKSVEATSFVHPTQGLDSIIAHIVDPSKAHEARAIHLVDAGGYYASDEVEDALQEIGGGLSSGSQNGVVQGCTFTSAGLTVTLATPSSVRIGTEHDLSGQSELLTAASTNWLYVDPAGDLVHTTGASPPSITSPENVLLWRIVTNGAAVTSFTDARFFIPNLDRKPSYTVRSSGTATDRNAEACFESIEAAMIYLEHFTSSGVSRKSKLIIRGSNTISATITVPIDDLIVEGEDGAEFVTGAALVPMFDCNSKDRIQFKNILFTNNHVGSWAIYFSLGGSENSSVERCRFQTGTQLWERGITNLTNITGMTVRDCYFAVSNYGVYLNGPTKCLVEGCTVDDGGATGIAGILFGDFTTGAGPNVITRCEINGFGTSGTSIAIRSPDVHVDDCRLMGALTGITVATASLSHRLRVTNTLIDLSSSTGLTGISLPNDTDDVQVQGCTITNTRGAGTYLIGDVPKGIKVGPTSCDRFIATGCTISGFYNSVGNLGRGIDVGNSIDATVSDCNITTAHTGIFADTSAVNFKSRGCRVQTTVVGLEIAGDQSNVSDASIILSSTIGLTGIILGLGADDSRISNCFIRNPRGVYGIGDLPVGIAITLCTRVQIADCIIRDFRNTTTPSLGIGINVANPASDDLTITGGHIQEAAVGIQLGAGVERAKITNVYINDTDTGIDLAGANSTVANCSIDLDASTGVDGILAGGTGLTVTGCRINNPRTVWGVEIPNGIYAVATGLKVDNCHIQGFVNPGVNGSGIQLDPGADSCTISDCTFLNCFDGVQTAATTITDVSITGCRFDLFESHGVLADHVTRITVSECQFKNGGDFAIITLLNCLDSAVTGNFLDGNAGASDNGIHLYGTDAAGEYARRFTITGNTIQAIGGHGIVLEGYVQNGTVSGNQVDGFLSATPLDPTALAGIRLFTVTGAGVSVPKYVTVNGNTVLRCWKGIVVEGTFADPIREITVDGNVIHHCAFGQAGGGISNFHSFGSVGVGVEEVRRITVSNNTIYKIGIQINDSDVEGFPAGVAVQGMGIVVNNTIGSTVVGNTITDTMSNGTGFNTGIYIHQGSVGHGAGNTFTNTGVVVNDNNCFWNTGLAGNGTAIDGIIVSVEKASDAATALHVLEDMTINGNTIHNNDFANIAVLVAEECTLRGVTIEGNTVSRSNSVGIDVFSLSTTVSVSGVNVRGNTVRDVSNLIGIRFHAGGTGTFAECAIVGNDIADIEANGILVEASNVAVTVADIKVEGNTVKNYGTGGGSAILLFCPGTTVTSFRSFTVSNNDIIDVAGLGDPGIDYSIIGTDTSDLVVQNNTLNAPGGLGISGRGISISTSASGATNANISRVTVTGNNIIATSDDTVYMDVDGFIYSATIADNTLIAGTAGHPLYVLTDRTNAPLIGGVAFVQDVRVTGNVCSGGGGSRIEMVNGNKIRGLVVSGNEFANTAEGGSVTGDRAGFSLHMVTVTALGSTPAVEDVVISTNTFRDCDEEGVSLRLGAGTGDDLVDGLVNITIAGNSFMNCAAGATVTSNDTVRFEVNGVTRNLTISDNSFTDCASTTPDLVTSGAVHILLSSDNATPTNFTGQNIRVLQNTLSGCGGVGILIEDSTFGTQWVVSGVDVSGNSIQNQSNDAIRLDLAAFVTADNRSISINNNVIDTVSAAANSDMGIVVLGPTSTTDVDDLRICGNSLHDTGGNNVGTIYVNINVDADGIVIDGNTVATSNATTAGILIVCDGVLSSVSISNNTLRTVVNNGIRIDVPTSDAHTIAINGNVVANATGDGIDFDVTLGTAEAVSISNNEIRSPGDNAIIVTAASLLAFTVNGNGIHSADKHGITMATLTMINAVSVSGNTIHDWSANAAATTYDGIKLSGDAAHNVVVSNNCLRDSNQHAIGYHFVIVGVIRTFSVSNNTLNMENTANTQSLLFATGAGADQMDMSFVGNSLFGAVTAINFTGSFSPDRSVCFGNNERATNGTTAGNWGVGGAGTFTNPFTNSIVTPNQD